MTPQERAEWVKFYTEKRLAEGASTQDAQRYAEQQVRELEEYGLCCDECGKMLETIPPPSRDPFPLLCWSCFKKENGLDREEAEYGLYEDD